MKSKMKTTRLLSMALLGLSSIAAEAATVWAPTSGDVDYLQFNIPGLSTNAGILALFDDSDFGGTALIIGSMGGEVTFTQSGSDWTAIFDMTSITLSATPQFTLGMSWNGGTTWFQDSSYTNLPAGGSADSYIITFAGVSGPNQAFIQGHTVAVDLQPIPVPAAVWLFGTGLLGMVAVARRRG